jgi:hypothetical protein
MSTELEVSDVRNGMLFGNGDALVAAYYKDGEKEHCLRCVCNHSRLSLDYEAIGISSEEIVLKLLMGQMKLTLEGTDEQFNHLEVTRSWEGDDLLLQFVNRYGFLETPHAIKMILEIVP